MNNNLVQEYHANCPYCGESFTTLVDLSAGDQEYIEDCQICCRPIVFDILTDSMTGDAQIHLRTENE